MIKISRPAISRLLAAGARYLLAGVFLLSAIGKLVSPSQFKTFFASFHWLSFIEPTLALYALISVELVVAFLLVYPGMDRIAGLISFGVLFLFSVMLMYASQSNVDKSCGCFGEFIENDTIDFSIFKNLILLLLSAVVAFGCNPLSQKVG